MGNAIQLMKWRIRELSARVASVAPTAALSAFLVSSMALAPVFAPLEAWANTNKKRKPAQTAPAKRSSGVGAVVKTDGALVYAQPDFDAEVLTNLKRGQRVLVSRGVTGEYAKFHRVRVGKTLGYIADIDVTVDGGSGGAASPTGSSTSKNAKNKKSKDAAKVAREKEKEREKNKDKKPKDRMPIYFTRYVGLLIGQTAFKEGIHGVDANENLLTYGVKVTGPDVLISGPVLDFNVALHYGAPDYYTKLSAIKPSGFVLWTDLLLLMPIVNNDNWMITFGLGPLFVLSNFKVFNQDRPMDLTALNVGASFSLGAAVRFEKMAVRLEGKYHVEKQSYRGLLAAVQTEF